MGDNNSGTKADDVLQWMMVGQIIIPQIVNVISHYKELSNSEAVPETDKARMKANLNNLRLPKWDSV